MNDPKSNEAANPGPRQTHHLDLPNYGRIIFEVLETPKAFILSCNYPSRPRRQHRRIVERWIDDLMKPLEADPRPLLQVTAIAGKSCSFGFSDGNTVISLGGLAS